jgi:rSAM/selenodomain-associated transferase 1
MKSDCSVIVFAKAPIPGYAKTRLAKKIGDQAAAKLAARMLAEAVKSAVEADLGPVELCCSPDATHAAFGALETAYHGRVTLSEQGEGNLGVRMQRALQRTLHKHPRALLIGTDAPGLDAATLRTAAAALQTRPAVFAPTFDGGYALVGLSQEIPGLFDDINWSTDQVMLQTRARLATAQLQVAELAHLHDVDEAQDLIHVPGTWLA